MIPNPDFTFLHTLKKRYSATLYWFQNLKTGEIPEYVNVEENNPKVFTDFPTEVIDRLGEEAQCVTINYLIEDFLGHKTLGEVEKCF